MAGRVIGGIQTLTPLQMLLKPPKILIFGQPGTGKTVFGGSADEVPEYRKVLVLDIEGGTDPLATLYPNVEVAPITTFRQLVEVFRDLHGGNHDYGTVMIDSLSEGQERSLSTIVVNAVKEDSSIDPDAPQWGHYRKNTNQVRAIVRAYRDLDMCVIFTATVAEEQDGDDGPVRIKPQFTKKLQGGVPAQLGMVGYLNKRTRVEGTGADKRRVDIRTMQWQGSARVIGAKDRTMAMPDLMEEPSMRKVYELIQAKKTELLNAEKELTA